MYRDVQLRLPFLFEGKLWFNQDNRSLLMIHSWTFNNTNSIFWRTLHEETAITYCRIWLLTTYIETEWMNGKITNGSSWFVCHYVSFLQMNSIECIDGIFINSYFLFLSDLWSYLRCKQLIVRLSKIKVERSNVWLFFKNIFLICFKLGRLYVSFVHIHVIETSCSEY